MTVEEINLVDPKPFQALLACLCDVLRVTSDRQIARRVSDHPVLLCEEDLVALLAALEP